MPSKTYSLNNIIQAGNWSISSSPSALFLPRIYQQLLSSNGKKTLRSFSLNGVLTKSTEELHAFFKSKGGGLVIERKQDFTYLWKDSYAEIDFNKKNSTISINMMTLSPELAKLEKELETNYISKVKKNMVFTIIKSSTGFEIKNMGDGSSPLINENYLPEVLEDLDFVVKSFKKSPPAGRICILNGEPGTGKTHLIRSLLSQLDCVFLIVPSNMIESLDKPEFVPLLLSIKNEHDKPIILIIEDGDVCLVPRKNDNISTIASLLNLSDGIMGSIIDIKMVISTNAEIKDMDQAILRPGRLCRNIHVGPLPYEQANKVFKRLMKDESANLDFQRFYTLAEIYDRFNNKDMIPAATAPQVKNVIGFSTPRQEGRVLNKGGKIGFGR